MTIDHIKKVLLTNSYMENNLKKKFKRFGYQNMKIPKKTEPGRICYMWFLWISNVMGVKGPT